MRTNLEVELNKFAKNVKQQSRSRLTKSGSNFSKNLYNSIDYDLGVSNSGNSFSLSFEMEDYGKFQDQGVRGAGGVRKTTSKFNSRNNKGKLWKIKGKNSPFKFGKSGGISPKHFTEWAKSKGISPFAVAKVVYHQGIEPKKFFTTSFEQQFKKLPEDLVKAFALDIDNLINFSTK